jgi:transposase
MLSSWGKQLGAADSAALAPQIRRPKPNASARQIKNLNRDIARLRYKLERAELIIDAQRTLCVAIGLPTADETSEDE